MSTCRRTRIQRIRTIEWRYQTQENVCLARTSNTQRQVHMKNVVFKHHVVFQKPQFLLEGMYLLQYSNHSFNAEVFMQKCLNLCA